MSFSDSAGTETGDAGQVDALVVADRAADDHDSGGTSVPSTAVDLAAGPCRRRSGSGRRRSRRRAGPCTSCRRSSASPGTSRVVIVNSWPASSLTGPSGERLPAGSSGPAGRRRCRRRGRWRRRPRAPGGRPPRGRRACRGSCSAGRRPSRRRPARGSSPASRRRGTQGADDLGSTHAATLSPVVGSFQLGVRTSLADGGRSWPRRWRPGAA